MSWMPLSFSPTFPLLPYFSTENTKEGFRYNPLIESLKEERKKEGRKERKKNRADSMLSFDRRNCFVAAREGKKRVFPPFFSPSAFSPFPTTSRQRRYITRLRSRSEKTRPKRIGSVNSFFKSRLSSFVRSNLLGRFVSFVAEKKKKKENRPSCSRSMMYNRGFAMSQR